MATNDRLVNPTEGYFARVDTRLPQIGVVKDNRDEERMGRLRVWIRGSTSLESDPTGWIWVNYCSPFAGATDPGLLGRAVESYDATQKSYGIWTVPPDLENEVLVSFVNGDIRRGYWTGCMYQKNMNQMIPGLGENLAFQSTDPKFEGNSLPVAEYNKLTNAGDSRRPYYEPLSIGLLKQGLLKDELRGAGTASARRESPSRVQGWLTPGGNQLILDDGEGSEMIRIRTKSGAQVLISETEGHIYMITRDGNAWMELNNDGHLDVYAGLNINLRAEANVNIHGDKDVNIEAGGNINMRSSGEAGIIMNADAGAISMNSATQAYISAVDDVNILSSGANILLTADGIIDGQSTPAAPAIAAQLSQKMDTDVIINTDTDNVIENVNIDTIVDRLPHHEPWPDHAEVVKGTRESVEEDASSLVAIGSVTEKAKDPLPVVGSPRPGMAPGVYLPKGYEGDQPQYTFSGTTTDLVAVNELTISDQGLNFIASYEKFIPNVYLDAAGLPTIGYGHLIKGSTPDYARKGPLSQEQAFTLLRSDAEIAANEIRKSVKVKLTQAQFDALTSFAFNVGNGAFRKSTLLKKLNTGDYSAVPSELARWNKAGGKVLRGLTRRRRDEGLMFSTPTKT